MSRKNIGAPEEASRKTHIQAEEDYLRTFGGVQVGDTVSIVPVTFGIISTASRFSQIRPERGRVVRINPGRRLFSVEFTMQNGEKIRESFALPRAQVCDKFRGAPETSRQAKR